MRYFNSDFNKRFASLSQNNINELIASLMNLFDTHEYHFCRATMYRFYFKAPMFYFKKEVAADILPIFFEKAHFSVLDFNKIFDLARPHHNLVTDSSPEHSIEASENWQLFLTSLQDYYWSTNEKKIFKNIHFYVDREPANIREMVLSRPNTFIFNNKPYQATYLFFDIPTVIGFYNDLFTIFFPEYQFQKKISTKKIKKYARPIGNGMLLGFSVDFAFIERELKFGYLEFPPISVEIFSDQLSSPISEKVYLYGLVDSPIARIHLVYFMGHFSDSRIGNSSQESNHLEKKTIFHFETTAFYLKIYLDYIERILLSIDA